MIENKDNNTSKKAVKTVSMIMIFTAFSKIMGLVRDILLARSYGENSAPFLSALRIPRDFFELILGAAILGVFIPVYNSFHAENINNEKNEKNENNEKNEKNIKNKKEADEFANILITVVFFATGILSFLGIVFSKQIVNFTVSGYDEATMELASNLLKILFPMIIFMGSTYILIGILQSKGEFNIPALVSSVSNIGIIVYFVFLNGHFGIYGLSAAYLISWGIQLLTLVAPLIKKKYKYKFIVNLKNPALIKSIKMSFPIMAGAWLVPAAMLIGQNFASLADSGNSKFYVSSFLYSTTMFLTVTGILTFGICNYIFPKLAQNARDERQFKQIVKNGLSASFFIMVPMACFAYVLRGEAFAVIFMHGEFTPELAASASDMFAILAPAIIMYSAIEILNRVFYSKNLVKFPMIASLAGITVNFIMCWVFISVLKFTPVYITLANFICQTVTAAILIIALKLNIKEILDKKFLANIIKIVLSSAILLIIIKILYYIIGNNAFESGMIKNILMAVIILIAGVCCYIGSNMIFKTDEMNTLVKMVKK